ncbi:MAG TPA: DJ-1/PfpI family protein [Steroidobacteraceae bacterium]|nr:DJ-1/PfpI family protein [Steroidobacteraceae bacterium]
MKRKRLILRITLGVIALGAIGFGGWIVSLPDEKVAADLPRVPPEESDTTLAALKPPKRQRPIIAIIGANEGTETVDYLMPFGILKRADVADVFALATKAGPVTLYPVFKVQPQATVADFDAQHPDGADYVIVPALQNPDDAAVLQWIKAQREKGATIISVCAGALVIANAGLLDGHRATTHWYYLKGLLKQHPSIQYVPNRRFVVDRGVATTTGITASMPMSLTLIEAIAGREKAVAVAEQLGVRRWGARHNSAVFKFTRPFALTAMTNRLAFWNHEELGLELKPGVDEVTLALVADAWSRTYRSSAVSFAATTAPIETRNGLRVFPARAATDWPGTRLLAPIGTLPPADALDETLRQITLRYGIGTARFVAMQLEYTKQAAL